MLNIIRFLAVLIAVAALSPQSYAQTLNKGMEGFTSVEIIVKGIDQAAKDCGITTAALRSAASFPVATSRLRISEEVGADLFLSVDIIVLAIPGGCIGTYGVDATTFGATLLSATNTPKVLRIRFWSNGGIITGSKDRFGKRMSEAIEGMAKDFVVNWTLDQQ